MTAHVPHTDEANARFQLVAFHIHHNTSLSKTHPAGLRATTQVTRLVLSGNSIRRKRHESVMKASWEVAGNAGEWLTPPSLWPIQAQGRLHLTSIGQWLVLAQLQGPIHFPAQYLPHLLQARQR